MSIPKLQCCLCPEMHPSYLSVYVHSSDMSAGIDCIPDNIASLFNLPYIGDISVRDVPYDNEPSDFFSLTVEPYNEEDYHVYTKVLNAIGLEGLLGYTSSYPPCKFTLNENGKELHQHVYVTMSFQDVLEVRMRGLVEGISSEKDMLRNEEIRSHGSFKWKEYDNDDETYFYYEKLCEAIVGSNKIAGFTFQDWK